MLTESDLLTIKSYTKIGSTKEEIARHEAKLLPLEEIERRIILSTLSRELLSPGYSDHEVYGGNPVQVLRKLSLDLQHHADI